LHYGSAVFEGIRFYNTQKGAAIFKLTEHVQRFFYSAKQLAMPLRYTEQEIIQAIVETVRINEVDAGYIRPLAYYGYGNMKVTPDVALPTDIIIACWPWGNYLSTHMADVQISPYIRIHPRSTVADAKISGHYVNSILAGLTLRNTAYHESLFLDLDGFVAEAGAANLFIVRDNKLFTPHAGTILEGITRNTIIELAKIYDIPIEEKKLTPQDIIEADEAFFTGTAVEITPIRSLDNQIIGSGTIGALTEKIHQLYQYIVCGKLPEFHTWLTFVE
jgi:branched-chain amino acid aminotransferase